MLSNTKALSLKKELPPLLFKDASKQAVSKAFNLESLGTLSTLPRELRDEIYSYMCNQRCPYEFLENGTKWCGLGLSMLKVSKAIREEFLTVLYTKGVFVIHRYWYVLKIRRTDIPFFNDISNIQISLDLSDILFEIHPVDEEEFHMNEIQHRSAIKGRPVSYFTGTSIMRNTCTISLNECSPEMLLPLLKSREFYAMSQLTGFKNVQLRFSADANDWLKLKTPQPVREEFHKLGTCPGFETMVLRTSSALERTLGSFTVTRGRWTDDSETWDQHVTFHPQDRPIKDVDSVGANSRLEIEEMTSALPFLTWTEKYDEDTRSASDILLDLHALAVDECWGF